MLFSLLIIFLITVFNGNSYIALSKIMLRSMAKNKR